MSGATGEDADAPLRIVVGFPPGGASDRVARAIAPALAAALVRPVEIDNRPGDAGIPAARLVAAATRDGRTLLLGNNSLLGANPFLFPDIGYDPLEDFAPVSLVGFQPSLLVVRSDLPAKTVNELIALARAIPRPLRLAVSGRGSVAHIAGKLFEAQAKLRLAESHHDGAAPALAALAAGQADLMFATASSAGSAIAGGAVRALAVTSAGRNPIWRGIPAMAEFLPDFEMTSWHGLVAPAGIPQSALARLESAVASALADEATRAALRTLAVEPAGGGSAAFAAHLRAERPKWAALAEASAAAVRSPA